jgi:hypothetical protein
MLNVLLSWHQPRWLPLPKSVIGIKGVNHTKSSITLVVSDNDDTTHGSTAGVVYCHNDNAGKAVGAGEGV